jgi:hypothetical protein
VSVESLSLRRFRRQLLNRSEGTGLQAVVGLLSLVNHLVSATIFGLERLGTTGADALRGARNEGVPVRRVSCYGRALVFQANIQFGRALLVDREMTLFETGWMHGVGMIV